MLYISLVMPVLFFILNIFAFKAMSNLHSAKQKKYLSKDAIICSIINTFLFFILYLVKLPYILIYIFYFVILFYQNTLLFKSVFIKTFFVVSYFIVDSLSIFIICKSFLSITFMDISEESSFVIGHIFSFLLLCIISFMGSKLLSNHNLEILSANKIQLKMCVIALCTFEVFLFLYAISYTGEYSVLYHLSGIILSFAAIISIYLMTNYSVNISKDIWKKSSASVLSGNVSENAEFDFSMYNNIDVVSGLYNKNYGFIKFDEIVASKNPFSIVFINVDHYDSVKINFSQDAADKYIKIVAEALKSTYREDDILFRLSDSKFIVILKNCPVKAADKTTSRAYNKVRQYSKQIKSPFKMSISFGSKAYESNTKLTHQDIIDISIIKMNDFNKKKNDIMDEVSTVYNKDFGLNILEDMCYQKINFSLLLLKINEVYAIRSMYGEEEFNDMVFNIGDTAMDSFSFDDTMARINDKMFMVVMQNKDNNKAQELWDFVYSEILSKFKDKEKPYGVNIKSKIEYYDIISLNKKPSEMFECLKQDLDRLVTEI